MARLIAAVALNTLTVGPGGSGETILVGEPEWFAWLNTARAFRYDGPAGSFTAHKEQASRGREGWYWKAYRRSDGRLRRAYLGPTKRLTIDRLEEAAVALAPGDAVGSAGRPTSPATGDPSTAPSHGATTGAASTSSAHLRLLGSFRLTDGVGNVVPIVSQRAQRLVAYLALERAAPQPRRQISFVLWPDSSEAQARNNLRQVLHHLRNVWPDAHRFLSVDASTLSLREGVDLRLDVDEYERSLDTALHADEQSDRADGLRAALEQAVGLYQGELFPGCYDEWIAPARERLIAHHQRTLDRLIGLLEERGDYRTAIEYGQQRLRLDSLDERLYRWLMRLHALNQDRAGALRVYHTCASVLERELGVEPDPTTRQAYEQILRQELGSASAPAPRSGLEPAPTAPWSVADPLPLIGRQREWAQVMTALRRMTRGEAHLIVIGGEAGIGKSRLAAELCEWAGHQGIRSAATRAYAAEGRLSFAPVADWLRSPALAPILPRLDPGSLSEISRLLPELLAQRPDLPRPSARIEDWQRQRFFQGLATAFLAADQPLILVLDDMQWCDSDTLEWLHFLLRFDRQARLLVTGTVRHDEVDRRHPLSGLLAGLMDARQLTEIELGPLDPTETSKLAAQVAGRSFLPDEARHIHLETEGNPLFVVETVRAGLAASAGSGDRAPTRRDRLDRTSEPRRLPPRVHAVISARLAQLSEPAGELASLAAIVGRAFTLEVLHEAGDVEERVLVQGLDELLRRHVVREQGSNAYDFAHDKIREVAYAELTDARRRLLHRRVAEALERVHATGLDAVAAQIAAHYANAGVVDRAAVYYQRAAEVAQRVVANQEAISLLRRGLTLLESLPPSLDRDARELGLQTALGVSLVATEGYGAPEVMEVYARSRQLCQIIGEPPSPPILRALAIASIVHARFEDGHALGDHLMSLADAADDQVLKAEAHYVLAMSLQWTGALVPARSQLEESLAHYDPARSAAHVGLYTQDPGVICLIRLALDLWLLGDPEASARRRAESLSLAAQLAHPFSLAYALAWDAILQSHRGDHELGRTQAEAAMALGRKYRMPLWLSFGTILHGWAVAEEGEVETGIDEIRRGMADFKATGSLFMRPFQLGLLAEQYGRVGNVQRGLTLIAEAVALVERTNERWCEAELHRRKGALLVAAGDDVGAEAAFRRAADVARYQGARAIELRSAVQLADLWRRHGRGHDVPPLLEPILQGLDAASDLPDLRRARSLLADVRTSEGLQPA